MSLHNHKAVLRRGCTTHHDDATLEHLREPTLYTKGSEVARLWLVDARGRSRDGSLLEGGRGSVGVAIGGWERGSRCGYGWDDCWVL